MHTPSRRTGRLRPTWLAVLGLVVLFPAGIAMLRLPDPAADLIIREDGIAETVGAACLLGASVLAVLTLRRVRAAGGGRLLLWSYAALALFLFVAAGEEISWGQRLLGIETPDAIAEINAQGEINLHNLYGDENGQNVTSKIYRLFWIGFGVVLPVLALWGPAGRLLRRYLPVPPIWVAALFVYQQLLWKPTQALWSTDPGAWGGTYRGRIGEPRFTVDTVDQIGPSGASGPAGLSEVMEAIVQVVLLAALVALFLAARRSAQTSGGPTGHDDPERTSPIPAPRGRHRPSHGGHDRSRAATVYGGADNAEVRDVTR